MGCCSSVVPTYEPSLLFTYIDIVILTTLKDFLHRAFFIVLVYET